MAYKTKFKPINTKKYIGDYNSIICRSLWERNICKFCDMNENIIKWSSEEIIVPYTNPLDGKQHNYYPDFVIQFKVANEIKTWMVEVKPKKQTLLKENASKKEKITWIINNAKWDAAQKYCQKNNMEFKIITEKDIFYNGK
jgi:hypothetical protein